MVTDTNMMKNSIYKIIIFSALFTYSFSYSLAQSTEKDLFQKIEESLETKPKFYISFDNKNSFISNRSGWFLGAKVGLEYDNIFRIGIGFNGLYNKTYSTYINDIKKTEEVLSFNYISIFAEYIFKNNKRYEFSLPISLGFGYSWLGDLKTSNTSQFQLLYEAQLNGMYFPVQFFGIGAGLGYRLMLKNNEYIDEQFTAPIYSLKVKLILGKIFKNE